VYRGRLRSTGEEVAVKVQRPGIGDTIALDMVLLRRLMSAVDANMPQLGRYQVLRAALPPGLMRTAGGALSGPERPTMQPEEQIWVGTSWLGSRADHRCRCAGTCISCYAFLRCLATCWCRQRSLAGYHGTWLHGSTQARCELNCCVGAAAAQISQPLTPLVDEFAGRLFGELDYLAEGRSAERFQARCGRRPYPTLLCMQVHVFKTRKLHTFTLAP